MSLVDATVQASEKRFRPIVMTSFTFILGVLPLLLAKGAGASRPALARARGLDRDARLDVPRRPLRAGLLRRPARMGGAPPPGRRAEPRAGEERSRVNCRHEVSKMRHVWVRAAAALAIGSAAAGAQRGDTRQDFIQKKLAAIEQFAAANQAALRKYTWTETVRFLLKDELRSTWQFSCRYGADGKIVRTAMGPPPPGTTAGPFAPKPGKESKEELEATVAKVRAVVAMYVPPETQKLEKAFQAGRVRTEKPIQGEALLRIADYARPGDSVAPRLPDGPAEARPPAGRVLPRRSRPRRSRSTSAMRPSRTARTTRRTSRSARRGKRSE